MRERPQGQQQQPNNPIQTNQALSGMQPDNQTGVGTTQNSQAGYLPNFDEIVLESPEFDFEELKELPNYFEKRYSDALYMGQMQNGKRHGKGVMRYRNGR